ncbi:pyridoxamine 5'-phosphate oxidase family protein [Bisgaard Taxon 46]
MQKRIVNFIKKHYLCAISCSDNNTPWTNFIYYAFDENAKRLIYISCDSSYHSQVISKNPRISGVITMPTKFIPSLQGVQFTGYAKKLANGDAETARELFKKSHSHYLIDELSVWAIDLEYVKLIDRSLGLYGKLEWHNGKEIGQDSIEDAFLAHR